MSRQNCLIVATNLLMRLTRVLLQAKGYYFSEIYLIGEVDMMREARLCNLTSVNSYLFKRSPCPPM